MARYLSLFVFLAIVMGGGLLIGFATMPGEWYASLVKPPFNPPNWIFGPVWTLLYVMIAVAGWRTWQRSRSGSAMKLWTAQMALNFVWSPVFFAAQMLGVALVVIITLLGCIVAFIVQSRRDGEGISALLFTPYAAWVSFATLLNASLWYLN
jgi:tryptophan-rich sensory protein